MNVTLYQIAERFVGMKEVEGSASNPQVLAMLRLDTSWPRDDAVPWCSAGMNFWAWLLKPLPRSHNLRARSWLGVGKAIDIDECKIGFDIVIMKQPGGPGADVIDAPGHVGLYSGHDMDYVYLLGANQHDSVNVSRFHRSLILGVRRLWDE